ncbi:leucine-rich repeat-containing protein 74B-like [Watersipora subatra]|uniref:leucine-rich repeat-containing protein 74B-like n=1 Tax=Watersipora subatra TaxID=2589382 RepID=UPI00355B9826
MSYLPSLSDYVGSRVASTAEPTSKASSSRPGDTNRILSTNQQIEKMFTGMSRSLSYTSARVARNKKIVKRNLQGVDDGIGDKDDISACRQSMTWTGAYDLESMDTREDTGHDTDLETDDVFEGFDHSGKTSYIEACQRSKVVPVSYYLRHMHESELKLRHHQLGSKSVKPIAISLVSNAKILSLDLTDNSLGCRGAHVLCDMLRENCFITHLNLSENHLGETSAEMLSDIIQITTSLTHVTLSHNDFNDRAAVFFAEAISNTTKIEYLNLSHNKFAEMSGVVLGPAIGENSSIQDLDLSWNSLRRKGAVAIAQGLKTNIMIKRLDLSWNGFGVDGSRELGKALMENTTLEELNVTNNRLTTEAAVLLGKGVAVSESLRVLKMGRNPMQSAGCWAVCSAILKNPHVLMKELVFDDVLVNKDFNEIHQELKNLIPDIHVYHGGLEPPKKPKAKLHPMVKVQNYITKHNLKLIDFFRRFDQDGSMSVSHSEFKEGLEDLGIHLQPEELDTLIGELDKDGDGEINYSSSALIPTH